MQIKNLKLILQKIKDWLTHSNPKIEILHSSNVSDTNYTIVKIGGGRFLHTDNWVIKLN